MSTNNFTLSKISRSYVGHDVSVDGEVFVGGFAGGVSDVAITDSYALASVSNRNPKTINTYLGGFVGEAVNALISDSYSAGLVSCQGLCQSTGPFIGSGSVQNSFWSLDTSGVGFKSPIGEGLSTEQFITDANSDGVIDVFDADNASWDQSIWNLDPEATSLGFPVLF